MSSAEVPNVQVEESRFKADDGLLIYVKKWLVPKGTPFRAKIVFNHGFSEHMGGYDHFFPDFAARGYEIIGYDQRGAGHTSPLKKDFGVTNEYYVFSDLEELLAKETKDYDGKLFLWGHSMGGAIALNYAVKGQQRERIDGYLANSPLIVVHEKSQVNPVLRYLAPIVAKIHPKFKQKVNLHLEYLTDDEAILESYKKDPLRLFYLTAEQGNDFVNRGKRLLSSVFVDKFVDRPVFVAHGTNDFVNDYAPTAEFFSLLKVSDKEFKTYEGWLHELTMQTKEKRDIHRDDVLSWLDRHTSGESVKNVAVEEPAKTGEESSKAEEPVKTVEEPVKPADESLKPAEREEPLQPVEESVEPVEEPVKAIEEPVRAVDEPVEAVEKPVEEPIKTEEPVEAVDEPVNVVEEPVKAVEEPVKAVEEPVKAVEEPAKGIEEPVEEPVKAVEEPAKAVEEPVEAVEEPVEEPVKAVDVDEQVPGPSNELADDNAAATNGNESDPADGSDSPTQTPATSPKKKNKNKNKKKKAKK